MYISNNLSLDSPISKLKYAFGGFSEGLSNDVFRSKFGDGLKSSKIENTKGYTVYS